MKIHIKKVDIAVISIVALFTVIAILLIFSLTGGILKEALTAILLLLIVTIVLLSGINMYRRIEKTNKKLLQLLNKKLPETQKGISAQTEAMFWLVQQISPAYPLPGTNTWNLPPDTINSILSIIKEEAPNQVVELSGGISTLIFSYVIDKGHIHSFHHEEPKVEKTLKIITKHGLHKKASVSYAPLAPLYTHGKERIWYHTDSIDRIAFINMLIVSGPHAGDNENLLYTALPHLYPKLKPGAVIVITHANSPGAQATLKEWLRLHPLLKEEYMDTAEGLIILRKPLVE